MEEDSSIDSDGSEEYDNSSIDEEESFDDHNAKVLNDDLENLSDSMPEDEDEDESTDEQEVPQDKEAKNQTDHDKPKRTRKKSSFDPEKNSRTVFLGNIALSTTKSVFPDFSSELI